MTLRHSPSSCVCELVWIYTGFIAGDTIFSYIPCTIWRSVYVYVQYRIITLRIFGNNADCQDLSTFKKTFLGLVDTGSNVEGSLLGLPALQLHIRSIPQQSLHYGSLQDKSFDNKILLRECFLGLRDLSCTSAPFPNRASTTAAYKINHLITRAFQEVAS